MKVKKDFLKRCLFGEKEKKFQMIKDIDRMPSECVVELYERIKNIKRPIQINQTTDINDDYEVKFREISKGVLSQYENDNGTFDIKLIIEC